MMLLSPACTGMGLLHMAPESLGLSPLGYNFSLHLHEAELHEAPCMRLSCSPNIHRWMPAARSPDVRSTKTTSVPRGDSS